MLDIFLCSYLYNFSYMMELFLTAIDTKPTIFPLKPSMAHTCVTPYIINFSFWSIWSFSPKYVAVYGIGLTWQCTVFLLQEWWYGWTRWSAKPTRFWETLIPWLARNPVIIFRPYVGPTYDLLNHFLIYFCTKQNGNITDVIMCMSMCSWLCMWLLAFVHTCVSIFAVCITCVK